MLYGIELDCDVSKTTSCFAKSRTTRPKARRHFVEDMKSKASMW